MSRSEPSDRTQRNSPGLLIDTRVGVQRVVAVQPKPSFLPFFKHQREEAAGTAGVKYGSDGVCPGLALR
jgi:hypothetical protein